MGIFDFLKKEDKEKELVEEMGKKILSKLKKEIKSMCTLTDGEKDREENNLTGSKYWIKRNCDRVRIETLDVHTLANEFDTLINKLEFEIKRNDISKENKEKLLDFIDLQALEDDLNIKRVLTTLEEKNNISIEELYEIRKIILNDIWEDGVLNKESKEQKRIDKRYKELSLSTEATFLNDVRKLKNNIEKGKLAKTNVGRFLGQVTNTVPKREKEVYKIIEKLDKNNIITLAELEFVKEKFIIYNKEFWEEQKIEAEKTLREESWGY